MILSARDLKLGMYFAHCDLSVTLTGVCDGVDLASPSIKRNLNICQGTIDHYAVGLFQIITNATLIIHRPLST